MNRVVARFQDGRLIKGLTLDFQPGKAVFHLMPEDRVSGGRPVEVRVAELKAVFFVKSLAGDRERRSRENDPAAAGAGAGRLIRVVFKDGEVLVGTTQGYDRSRPGFFVVPVDPKSNNQRCFVVAAATQEVAFL
ncbi:MAG TPA: hypothetical protein VF121_17190 [Thermoanaerobaculia bacterium]|nr:hypothetical protein [Thermoanaerobaculia bacterium]